MRIGIDISQIIYHTGVSNYTEALLKHLLQQDKENEYVLFGSSLRQRAELRALQKKYQGPRVSWKFFPFPPIVLDILWNRLHIIHIEWLIGKVDVFLSSDWTQPPSSAKKATILYDLVVLQYPEETARIIVETQKRRLHWVKKEVDRIICISEATKKDAMELLHIPEERLSVVYPGF